MHFSTNSRGNPNMSPLSYHVINVITKCFIIYKQNRSHSNTQQFGINWPFWIIQVLLSRYIHIECFGIPFDMTLHFSALIQHIHPHAIAESQLS